MFSHPKLSPPVGPSVHLENRIWREYFVLISFFTFSILILPFASLKYEFIPMSRRAGTAVFIARNVIIPFLNLGHSKSIEYHLSTIPASSIIMI